MTDHVEPQKQPATPSEPQQTEEPILPPRLATVTTDPFTIIKKGAGPDGTGKRAS